MEVIRRFPLLEELELSGCCDIRSNGVRVFEVVATCKGMLTATAPYSHPCYTGDHNGDREAMAIARLHELRSLELVLSHLSNQGLADILDNCLHLKSLSIYYCPNVSVNNDTICKPSAPRSRQ
ncbi:unnamed protein product [Urochloa humidicola]